MGILKLDVTDDAGLTLAAKEVKQMLPRGKKLYAIVNNAAVLIRGDNQLCLHTNLNGTKKVCDTFIPLLDPSEGRIVNTASAAGPMFVKIMATQEERDLLTDPNVTWERLDEFMQSAIRIEAGRDAYGLSKACVNTYTM